jgi:hypothetical protein
MEPFFEKHPDKRPKDEAGCTALWRGYVATFEIRNKRLILNDIKTMGLSEIADGDYSIAWKSVKSIIIPNDDMLEIDWFSGILVLPYGDRVNNVHMGYGSTYSNYILLEIKNGILSGVRKYDCNAYEQFKEKQFQAFKKTDAYTKYIEKMQKEGQSVELMDNFLRRFVVDYTSEFIDEEESSGKSVEGK